MAPVTATAADTRAPQPCREARGTVAVTRAGHNCSAPHNGGPFWRPLKRPPQPMDFVKGAVLVRWVALAAAKRALFARDPAGRARLRGAPSGRPTPSAAARASDGGTSVCVCQACGRRVSGSGLRHLPGALGAGLLLAQGFLGTRFSHLSSRGWLLQGLAQASRWGRRGEGAGARGRGGLASKGAAVCRAHARAKRSPVGWPPAGLPTAARTPPGCGAAAHPHCQHAHRHGDAHGLLRGLRFINNNAGETKTD